MTPLEPSVVARLAPCSACGACDAQLHPDDAWDRGLVGPPSRWVVVLGEHPERWASLAPAIAYVPAARAEAMQRRCHVHVPFEALRERAHRERPPIPPKKKRIHDPG